MPSWVTGPAYMLSALHIICAVGSVGSAVGHGAHAASSQFAGPSPTTATPAAPAGPAPSAVLRLANMVSREELLDDDEYSDIVDDITSEIEDKYGQLAKIVIPKPDAGDASADPPGVGLVFVEFKSLSDAKKAQVALHGRQFADNTVVATFYNEGKFAGGRLE